MPNNTFEDILATSLVDVAATLSSGDVNCTFGRLELVNRVDGPWAPQHPDFTLESDYADREFVVTMRRKWHLSATDPLSQLSILEDIRDSYRMVLRDFDLTIVHALPDDDGDMSNPYTPGTDHHRFWEANYSLEGARIGLAALQAAGWSTTTWDEVFREEEGDDYDEDEEVEYHSDVTVQYVTTLVVLGNDDDIDDYDHCEFFLQLDVPSSDIDEVFERIASGTNPNDAWREVTGTDAVVVLD